MVAVVGYRMWWSPSPCLLLLFCADSSCLVLKRAGFFDGGRVVGQFQGYIFLVPLFRVVVRLFMISLDQFVVSRSRSRGVKGCSLVAIRSSNCPNRRCKSPAVCFAHLCSQVERGPAGRESQPKKKGQAARYVPYAVCTLDAAWWGGTDRHCKLKPELTADPRQTPS